MEEVCEMFLKTCQTVLGLRTFLSTPKPHNIMKLFWKFVGGPVWPKCFDIYARKLDEHSTKCILKEFFPSFIFYSIPGQTFKV